MALLNAAGKPLQPTPDENGMQTADTIKYWMAHPITPSPYAVYEQVNYSPERQIFSKWRLHSFTDGKFALQHFDPTGTKVDHTVVWDGKHRIVIDYLTHTTISYLMKPTWGAGQMTVLVKQAATKERKDITPDASLLLIPVGYEEHLPSEVSRIFETITGVKEPPCEAARKLQEDSAYFGWQVEKPFAIERVIQTMGTPRILYKVFSTGTIVRSDFRGTDAKITVLDPARMERVVLDTVGKSKTTFPWDSIHDTEMWRALTGVAESDKSALVVRADEEDQYVKTNSYIERSPSEAYTHYLEVVGQKPDPNIVDYVKNNNVAYKQGQSELAERAVGASCPNNPAAVKKAAEPKN